MSQASSADPAERGGGLVETAIPRVTLDSDARFLAAGLAQPLIYTDALDDWPARGKWTTAYFAQEFGDHFGLIPASFFDGSWGKATSLREYLHHLEKEADHTPGFWVDQDGLPLPGQPAAPCPSWAFYWRAFRDYPQLYSDLGRYPERLGNLVPDLAPDVRAMLEGITKRDFFSIYISREGTVTPFHADFHGTTGSLAQFEGTKHVTLIAPLAGDPPDIGEFDPDAPDYARFLQMRGRTAFRGILEPGGLLIIPPGYWHHVRCEEHSVTLSHNFFASGNLAAYLRGIFRDIAAKDQEAFAALFTTHFPAAPFPKSRI